jgi:hypothetical protein
MFQAAVQPLLIWAICRWIIRGKAPIVTLACLAAAFFVLQPIKSSYRQLVWFSGRDFSTTEKLQIYGKLVKAQWLDGGNKTVDIGKVTKTSARNRLSLLLMTAHYVEWTPYPNDYKNGATLGFLLYGWVPRVLWPGKPIAQQAEKMLPAEYNVQTVENQSTTMFGVGHVAEAYVNFGLAGIIPVFLLMGVIYRIPQLLFERQQSTATLAIFVAAMIVMVPIGSSISNAFGGFVQQMLVQSIMLRAFTRTRTRGRTKQISLDRRGGQVSRSVLTGHGV